ncbi:MAG: hypothetical protein P8123_09995, partial [bacterium]
RRTSPIVRISVNAIMAGKNRISRGKSGVTPVNKLYPSTKTISTTMENKKLIKFENTTEIGMISLGK